MPKQKYYVVWSGNKTGIFLSWEECSKQVVGFSGAKYKAFENRIDAENAFNTAYEENIGKQGKLNKANALFGFDPPISESFCVDASCIGNPGLMEYHGVHTATGDEIFHQGPFEKGTNNIGEFLAIVHALALLKKKGWSQPIYSDSDTAILWVNNKNCKTKNPKEDKNIPIFELIVRAEAWLEKNEYTTQILKWDTKAWGEIPADYGRK